MKPYNYVIIQPNCPDLERESALLYNKYKSNKKYAFICKGVDKDGSENIYFIDYSNDLEDLHSKASKCISWYNYPLGLKKDIQGYISEM